jgi:hypothetical protein
MHKRPFIPHKANALLFFKQLETAMQECGWQLVLGLASDIDLDDALLKKLRIARVKYSEMALQKFHNEVAKGQLRSHRNISSMHIDYKINRIVVTAPRNQLHEVVDLFKASSVDLAMVDFRVQTSTVTLTSILDDGSCKR